MDEFGGLFINQNIADMSITNAKHITNHRRCGNTLRVRKTTLEPLARPLEFLQKEILKSRSKSSAHLPEYFQLESDGLFLSMVVLSTNMLLL